MPRIVSDALVTLFEHFKEMQYEGIPGVMRIKSKNPGPIVGITACTHGNEPSGLAIFEYLLKEKNIEKTLRCGTLYLVINNIRATEKFFDATNEEEIRKSRYCDINMNRLPKEVLRLPDDSRYEVLRTKQLLPIWQCFEFGLDVHSTLDPSDPMIISRGEKFFQNLVHGFPIKKLISNIDKVQIGLPAFALYGKPESDAKIFAIEAGQHTDPRSFERAATCAMALLENLDMLPHTQQAVTTEYEEYYIDDSVTFPDLSFDLVKDFKSYEEIHKGDLLARNAKGEEIRSVFNGHLIMPTSLRGTAKDISEEITFISRPVKMHRA